ncbi:hypothetical protein EDB19DRAFT_170600 [Suillus lakei]|nr:hypothetical protein EDB19DRAFT_170600 [Suillus lakei]
MGASAIPRGVGGDAGDAVDTGGTKATFTANSTGSTRGGKTRVEKYVGINVQGNVAAITHRPVGIDAERVARDTLCAGIQPKLEAPRVLYADKIIIGRDELDVVKGVSQKVTHHSWQMFLYSA